MAQHRRMEMIRRFFQDGNEKYRRVPRYAFSLKSLVCKDCFPPYKECLFHFQHSDQTLASFQFPTSWEFHNTPCLRKHVF